MKYFFKRHGLNSFRVLALIIPRRRSWKKLHKLKLTRNPASYKKRRRIDTRFLPAPAGIHCLDQRGLEAKLIPNAHNYNFEKESDSDPLYRVVCVLDWL